MARAYAIAAIFAVWVGAARDARADGTVALLPLDAEPRLEIYGQPVASELARSLAAAGIGVAVVGPKSTVPDAATLIIDGTIARGAGDAITLSVRIRSRVTGAVLQQITADAPTLTAIDRAAADLSARALPAVRDQLALIAPPSTGIVLDTTPHEAIPLPRTFAPPPAPPLRIAIDPASAGSEQLATALVDIEHSWAAEQHVPPALVTLSPLELAISHDDRAADVPIARARVRLRIATTSGSGPLFDRVIVTDSVVGDRGQSTAALAARAAREVLAIAQPIIARTLRAPR